MNTRAEGPPDDQLWSRARHGDPSAFGELFTRHSKTVYNQCFRLTGSWATAEDLTSVVFLEAWRRREETTGEPGTVLPWLLTVTSDVVRHSTRAVRRHRRLLARLPPAVIEGDASDDVMAAERQMQQILRVFRRLPHAEQDVLALCVWGGRSYAEAAVALGVPVGTVRSRLARAHAHMRRLTESVPANAGVTESPRLDT
ncbi:RNA polymerase sigma-70 factor (ECF subfamily) [Haloactinopolyspora alba]|uniref:RNA polymerase sigma-70 factor (ECF subfamily) n=1 Tax=Haloactinopolyspora alba TaxID=648780 RepID=A0A2P8DXA0_9ACTN|nr:RNA polymerase sigma factor [Haloactinopolyspora alba]PSL01850.1 RNA polymerase sigma-70 factor (ECF subfamily) [Haloactinopolyspora alba]